MNTRHPYLAAWILTAALAPCRPAIASEPATTIAGHVRDASGRPVAEARLVLSGGDGIPRETAADTSGAFRFEDVAPGAYVLRASRDGYSEKRAEVKVGADARSLVEVTLHPRGWQETVVVIGTETRRRSPSLESADIPGSVDILAADQLRDENVDFGVEILRKVPGVYTSDYNQGIVAGDIGIRGFNTEADVAHTALRIDDIPSNLNSGFAEINGIFPLEMESIEMVKGTNDPRYGLYNIAGNLNVYTHRDSGVREARMLYGDFGTFEAQGFGSFQGERVSQTYFAGYRTSDGYRDHSAYDKYALSAKVFWRNASGRVRLGVIGRTFDWDADAPGYLTRSEALATPTASPAFSNTDGGTVDDRRLSAHLEFTPRSDLHGAVRVYGQKFRHQRFVRFTAAGSQQERLEDETQYGALATLNYRPSGPRFRDLVLSWGADVQFQDNLAQRYQAASRVRGPILRDQDFTFDYWGMYTQAEARPISRLRLVAGVRFDRLGGEFTNQLTSQRLDIIPYGTIWQPKVGAVATVAKGTNAYANWGRAFQVGVGAGAYSRQDIGYSTNDGWEVGLRTAPSERIAARVAYWEQHATDEVRLKFDNSGDSENIGETKRDGFDVEVNARPHPRVTVWAVYSHQRARIVEPGRAEPELRGKELNHVPTYTAKAGLDLTPIDRLTVSVWWYGQDDYELTNDNALNRYGDQSLWNAAVRFTIGRYSVGVQAKNLLDRYYEGTAWFDGTTTLHSPGEGRGFYVTTGVAF